MRGLALLERNQTKPWLGLGLPSPPTKNGNFGVPGMSSVAEKPFCAHSLVASGPPESPPGMVPALAALPGQAQPMWFLLMQITAPAEIHFYI